VTVQPLGFRRVVLGLLPGAPMSATALAVDFASLLDAELLGLFIDDLGLSHLAAMPTARAISASGAGWSRLEPSHALGAANFAVEADARRFAEASRRLRRRRFEVVRGGINDGRKLEIRAQQPGDREGLRAAVRRASPKTLYHRFFAVKRKFSEQKAHFFLDVDFVRHVVLVAVTNEDDQPAIIGGCRYVVIEPGRAEVAFSVIDDY
jgi:hypothetical protein